MTLKEIHKESANLREEMLTNLANFAADIDEKQKAKALRQMKKLNEKQEFTTCSNFKERNLQNQAESIV